MCRYYIIITFIFVPFFAMANSYAAGLTDWNMATIYGKVTASHPIQRVRRTYTHIHMHTHTHTPREESETDRTWTERHLRHFKPWRIDQATLTTVKGLGDTFYSHEHSHYSVQSLVQDVNAVIGAYAVNIVSFSICNCQHVNYSCDPSEFIPDLCIQEILC
jgi:hypothetical protein